MANSSLDRIPIIYSADYDIKSAFIKLFHPFDTGKYSFITKYLERYAEIDRGAFINPVPVSAEQLKSVHTAEYLESLKRSGTIAQIAELPLLKFIPAPILRRSLLRPMMYGTGGTVLGVRVALDHGWAINLSGGYHHAKPGNGEGFCYFADVPIAVKEIWKEKPDLRILIVDLDAHQGNGNSIILGDDERITILDIFNGSMYPNEADAKAKVKYKAALRLGTRDEEYLSHLSSLLPMAISEHAPGLIIFCCGTDVYVYDPIGGLSISEAGIIERDRMVFEAAVRNKIPILMLIAGAYHNASGRIAGRSILNILRTVLAE